MVIDGGPGLGWAYHHLVCALGRAEMADKRYFKLPEFRLDDRVSNQGLATEAREYSEIEVGYFSMGFKPYLVSRPDMVGEYPALMPIINVGYNPHTRHIRFYLQTRSVLVEPDTLVLWLRMV